MLKNIYLKSSYKLKNLNFKSLKTRRAYVKDHIIRITTVTTVYNILSLSFYPKNNAK